jgi:hypothetical protein
MGRVKIIARVRPFIGEEIADESVKCDASTLSVQDPRNAAQRLVYKLVKFQQHSTVSDLPQGLCSLL